MAGALRRFLAHESAGGVLLFAAAVAAMLVANSPLLPMYAALLEVPFGVRLGAWALEKPVLLWINDGLMAVFFLQVGLEIKRETRVGALAQPGRLALPAAAALGGMVVPAGIYVLCNHGDAVALRGWAIPAATDIAFALGVLSLLGTRVPAIAKTFLLAVAVIDDLGAIAIIALFYTAELSLPALALGGVALIALLVLNLAGVTRIAGYLLVGALLWLCVLKSGVHATLAGVAVALAIPLRGRNADSPGPLGVLEHALHPWVAFGILPIFAFANAGVPLGEIGPRLLLDPITVGITLGLALGKPIGVFGTAWLLLRARGRGLAEGIELSVLLGVAMLCGIGFTMSLFIGTLALPTAGQAAALRLGVIIGSILSAGAGLAWLRVRTST